MGTTIGYTEPRIVGTPGKEPRILLGPYAQSAAWRRGDILQNITTGTVSPPPVNGTSTLAGVAGPVLGTTLHVSYSASAGAPQATYYGAASYTASGLESVATPFVINVPAGNLPTVLVDSAGAPASADHFAAYLGTSPGNISLQQATRTTTALGATFTAANPLTNSVGWNRSVTNPSANIVGMAVDASSELFFSGGGGSFAVGPGSLLGAQTPMSPAITEAQSAYVIGLGQNQQVEMNLINTTAFYPSLIGTTAGLALDTATGFFIVDPGGSNKILTIVDRRPGVFIGPTTGGQVGDGGVRVIVEFAASSLVIQ